MLPLNTGNLTPKISVVIPVYNAEKYIKECIDSILKQSFTDFEVILVDDGSTDKSSVICRKYSQADARVRYFYQENAGVSAARNRGLELARGEFISFVDSDDYLELSTLKTLFQAINEGGYDIACCSYRRIDSLNTVYPYILPNVFAASVEHLAKICYENYALLIHASVWGKLYRRSIIENYGLSFIREMSLGEDTMFNLSYFRKINKAILLEYVGYNYVNHGGISLTSTPTQKAFIDLLYTVTCEKKYFSSFVDLFDVVNFSNRCIISLSECLRAILKNKELRNKKIDMIKTLLSDKKLKIFINNCQIESNLRYRDVLHIYVMKIHSPIVIFITLSLINSLSLIWQKIKFIKRYLDKDN